MASRIAADAGVAYVRADTWSEDDVICVGRILAGCRSAMRGVCELETRVNLARERVSDAADMLTISSEP